jgi:hypothetical protein
MEAAIAGIFAVLAASVPAWIYTRKTHKAVEAVHTEVKTNHGKAAFEYLEMVEEVSRKQDHLVDLIAGHTIQDDINFRLIERRLERMERAL